MQALILQIPVEKCDHSTNGRQQLFEKTENNISASQFSQSALLKSATLRVALQGSSEESQGPSVLQESL